MSPSKPVTAQIHSLAEPVTFSLVCSLLTSRAQIARKQLTIKDQIRYYNYALLPRKPTTFETIVVGFAGRNTNRYKIRKFCKAIFSVIYKISPRDFAVLRIFDGNIRHIDIPERTLDLIIRCYAKPNFSDTKNT